MRTSVVDAAELTSGGLVIEQELPGRGVECVGKHLSLGVAKFC